MPVSIHVLDRTDRGRKIRDRLKSHMGTDDKVLFIELQGEVTPGCDLALVHWNDREMFARWCEPKAATRIVYYTGGNPRSDSEHLWIQRSVGNADALTQDEYGVLVRFARNLDNNAIPDILSPRKAESKEDSRSRLLRLVILGWVLRDESRVRRLSASARKTLLVASTSGSEFDKALYEKLEQVRSCLENAEGSVNQLCAAGEPLYQAAKKALGELR